MEPERIRQWQPASTFSSTERFWKRRIVWKVRAMPSLTMRWVSQFVMSLPSKRTVPLSDRWFPVMRLKTVVLPAPFGPMSPTMAPWPTSKEISFTAISPPKDLVRF